MSHPLWQVIRDQLTRQGFDVDALDPANVDEDLVHAICIVPDMGESVRKMAEFSREHVVMVRVDADTLEALDAWVRSGAVSSRSEAAALFIREGLRVRARELDQLRDALQEVEEAQRRLQDRVKQVLEPEDE